MEGSKVSTSYTFQIKIDAEDPIALRANSTIEFMDLPTGVFLKPGGIWVNRLPAYTEPVEATAKRCAGGRPPHTHTHTHTHIQTDTPHFGIELGFLCGP